MCRDHSSSSAFSSRVAPKEKKNVRSYIHTYIGSQGFYFHDRFTLIFDVFICWHTVTLMMVRLCLTRVQYTGTLAFERVRNLKGEHFPSFFSPGKRVDFLFVGGTGRA